MDDKISIPDYYQAFKCIAGTCEETCCAGWYIAIDEETYKKYKKVKHPEMQKRLQKELVARKGNASQECAAKIKLKNNRCAFLNTKGLCDIYSELGERYLSETCKLFPRTINAVGTHKELSLALSCPEAARLILLRKEPIRFDLVEDTFKFPILGGQLARSEGKAKTFEDCLPMIRTGLFNILQDRKQSFISRWQELEQLFLKLEQFRVRRDIKGLTTFLNGQSVGGKKPMANSNPKAELEQLQALWYGLIELRQQKKWPSTRYEACYEQMVSGLSDTAQPMKWQEQKYTEGVKRFNQLLEGELGRIMENYFVNYIYERLVPLDKPTVLESFEEMKFYFYCIKLHMIGMSLQGEVTLEQIVQLIQSFTRVFDHNEQLKINLKKYVAERGIYGK